MREARILLCTPCTGEMVTTVYLQTIVSLYNYRWKSRDDVKISLSCISISDIYKARNCFAAQFQSMPEYTHLLFVDSDIGFHPRLVDRMIDFDRDFVSALCPFRALDARRFHEMARRFDDPRQAERLALNFVAADRLISENLDPAHPAFRLVKGFARVGSIGAGVMLLKHDVFDRLAAQYPDLFTKPRQYPYTSLGVEGPVHQCFSPHRTDDGNFLSEDKSFCHRWAACGGEIWACVDEDVTHVGMHGFSAAYVDRMKLGLFQTAQPE